MSRTDKTNPLWVRHAEHDPRPVHDHRQPGACDLPPAPTRTAPATRCRWEHPSMLLFAPTCCSGCQRRACVAEWQLLVRVANRGERYEGRRIARRYLSGVERD